MYKDLSYIAIIPARSGSKGLKNKNILPVNNHPLIAYSIAAAKASKYIDRVIVTTDGKKIANVAMDYGAEVIDRPSELAEDIIMPDIAISHAIDHLVQKEDCKVDNIVFMQPTSPLRDENELDLAIEHYVDIGADSLFSACNIHPCLWRTNAEKEVTPINYDPLNRQRRQDGSLDLIETGSFYISKAAVYKANKDRFGGKISYHLTNSLCLFEVDNRKDLDTIETILNLNNSLKRFIQPSLSQTKT
tara:strand:- start:140 stop:877 length:738 start_codon:yes stop_codon:yes gene_type:complete